MNDITYVEIPLAESASEYIKDTLEKGNSLSSLLLKNIDLSLGVINTYLPKNVSKEAVHRFNEGGKTSLIKSNSWLISKISNFLKDGENNYCITENALAKASDTWLKGKASKVFYYSAEVYHFIEADNSSIKKIGALLKESTSAYPPVIGFITKANQLNDEDKVSLETLTMISENINKIFIGTYDGESYLIWEKLP